MSTTKKTSEIVHIKKKENDNKTWYGRYLRLNLNVEFVFICREIFQMSINRFSYLLEWRALYLRSKNLCCSWQMKKFSRFFWRLSEAIYIRSATDWMEFIRMCLGLNAYSLSEKHILFSVVMFCIDVAIFVVSPIGQMRYTWKFKLRSL